MDMKVVIHANPNLKTKLSGILNCKKNSQCHLI